jgi:hypothetical protein
MLTSNQSASRVDRLIMKTIDLVNIDWTAYTPFAALTGHCHIRKV